MAIPIALLLEEKAPVVSIGLDDSLAKAVTLMIDNDYTQLPIGSLKKSSINHYFVTSKSINQAMQIFDSSLGELKVKDALVQAKTVDIEEDLFSKMDDLLESDAVIVVNKDNEIEGIITNYDTTLFLRKRAEDILLVEDIESTLKDHLSLTYGDIEDPNGELQTAINALSTPSDTLVKDIKAMLFRYCSKEKIDIPRETLSNMLNDTVKNAQRTKTFKDLTLSEYIQLTFNEQAWSTLESTFDMQKKPMRTMLESVRSIRNKLMHFRPDIEDGERKNLRFCADWFKNHQPSSEKALDTIRYTEIDSEVINDDYERQEDIVENKTISAQSKYTPLVDYLHSQSENKVSFSFDKIEQILQSTLPSSAREHRAWWANDRTSHTQSKLWLEAGWRVTSINMTEQTVVFAKTREREWAFIDFFSEIMARLNEKHPDLPLSHSRPNGRPEQTLAHFPGKSLPIIAYFSAKRGYRLELYIDRGSKDKNRAFFDAIKTGVEKNNSEWCERLKWEILEDKKACRIALYAKDSVKDSDGKLKQLIAWTVEQLPLFYNVLEPHIEQAERVSHKGV